MHNTFSFSRLWLLIKKQWFDNAKLYLLSGLALIGLLTIIFIFWSLFSDNNHIYEEENTYVIFMIMLFAAGLIFASTTFAILGDKPKGIYWLGVPATTAEKLACGIFYSIIGFLLLYIASFFVIQKAALFFIGLKPGNTVIKLSLHDLLAKNVVGPIFFIFIALQSLFTLGSVYFEKFAFIKTVLVTLFIVFLYSLFVQLIIHQTMLDKFGMQGLSSFKVYDGDTAKVYRLAPWIEEVLTPLAKFIWAPVFLTATYFRLKEKEI